MPPPSRDLFLIEDSTALGIVLQSRIAQKTSVGVKWYKTFESAAQALREQRPILAVTGLQLPDAQNGEILDLLAAEDIPTILFTATLNRKIRERFASPNIIDYFLKDTESAIDRIVHTICRFTDRILPAILIVDDVETARMQLINLLKPQNYQIFEARSGEEALEILSANSQIELVITDHHMADMEGNELTRRIRKHYSSDQLRVIGISASSDPYLSASFLKAGASDFVYSPFIPEEVKYRVESNIETLGRIKYLRFLAERDSLTSLYNRRAFFERAQQILDDCKAENQPASVAILDIDHFKKVNDTYGHDTGDRVIKAVAKVLSDHGEQEAVLIARFGGEEFVLLFADRTAEAVQAQCDDIRQEIEALRIRHNGMSLGVTVSMGVAMVQHDEGMDNNLNAADQMLYMAKTEGRNRVVSDAKFYQT
tara:strand:- start:160370 stop:161647 length:1278 start_codon:yes stop_codon:yes gene_type:complete